MAETQNPEKKKALILVGLFLVLGAAGVFQLLPSSPDTTEAKKEPKKPATSVAEPDLPKNPSVAFNLPTRDPFKGPDDLVVKPPLKGPSDPPKAEHPSPVAGTLVPVTPNGLKGDIGNNGGPGREVAAEPGKFNYTLSGVLVGDQSIAVFRDPQGHERMIKLGGSIDPESKVTFIDKTGATVKYRGEMLHLRIGGTSVAK